MGESRLRRGRGGNCVGDFPFLQFFAENAFDLLANAVHALIGYNFLIDGGEETRGLFRSPLRYGESAIILLFVEFDICARISLRDLKEYSALREFSTIVSLAP